MVNLHWGEWKAGRCGVALCMGTYLNWVGNCRSLHLVTGRSYSVPREGVLSLLGDININECPKLVYIYATSGLSFNREFHKLYFLWPCKTCFLYIKNLWLLKSGFIWLSLVSIAKSLPLLWSDYIFWNLKKEQWDFFWQYCQIQSRAYLLTWFLFFCPVWISVDLK